MINLKLSFTIDEQNTGRTLSAFLLAMRDMSHRLICRMKHDRRIHVNGIAQRTNFVLSLGDLVELYVDIDKFKNGMLSEDLSLDIVFEDDSLFAVNKRPGMIVHPVAQHQSGTVANGIAHLLELRGFPPVVRPLSRLDRDTSGILLFAKNAFIQESMIRQMSNEGFTKRYFAVVHGDASKAVAGGAGFTGSDGLERSAVTTIDLPIARKPGSIMHREVNESGRHAITHFSVLASNSEASLLDVRIETGRTHQIRVHLTHIGFPIIGDDLYYPEAPNNFGMSRQALHSYSLSFVHPFLKEAMELTAPMPEDMKELLERLDLRTN